MEAEHRCQMIEMEHRSTLRYVEIIYPAEPSDAECILRKELGDEVGSETLIPAQGTTMRNNPAPSYDKKPLSARKTLAAHI
jgi:hypothetical protein